MKLTKMPADTFHHQSSRYEIEAQKDANKIDCLIKFFIFLAINLYLVRTTEILVVLHFYQVLVEMIVGLILIFFFLLQQSGARVKGGDKAARAPSISMMQIRKLLGRNRGKIGKFCEKR